MAHDVLSKMEFKFVGYYHVTQKAVLGLMVVANPSDDFVLFWAQVRGKDATLELYHCYRLSPRSVIHFYPPHLILNKGDILRVKSSKKSAVTVKLIGSRI